MSARSQRFEELALPKGESLVWQGRPCPWGLAFRVFHVQLVTAYFALLFAARVAIGVSKGQTWLDSVTAAAPVIIPLVIVLALLGGISYLYSRTSRYSITNRRVLLQFGAVLPMTLNIPLRQIASAGVKQYADGSGDLPLSLITEKRQAYLLLWPHVRPWRLTRVEPMLRSVPDAAKVAGLLAQTLKAASPQTPEPVVTAMPTPRPAQLPAAIATAA